MLNGIYSYIFCLELVVPWFEGYPLAMSHHTSGSQPAGQREYHIIATGYRDTTTPTTLTDYLHII
jgi:hypothetical protein